MHRLIDQDKALLEKELAISKSRLAPLDDPLNEDFGLNRWLADEREERYSDWLEYAIWNLGTPALVYGLFDLPIPPSISGNAPATPSVHREYCVERGLPGHTGRLDLIVSYPATRPLIIEVKVASADESTTSKQSGYIESIPDSDRVLLVTEGSEQERDGFLIRTWSTVARQIRRALPSLCAEGRIVIGAMLAAFAGAIEQNLCGYPARPISLLNAHVPLSCDQLIAYLQEVHSA
jgi:hypothetical protein